MKLNKEYISTAVAYAIVIGYIVLQNEPLVTAILVGLLFIFHTLVYSQQLKQIFSDKESSVSRLEFRLAKSREKQEESYKRFLSLSTSFGSGLLMVDEDGIIQLANKETTDYFGIDFNNKDYKNTVEIKSLYKFINQSYLLETKLQEQMTYNDRVFDMISTPLFENKVFKGCFVLIHDITQLKTAEKFQKRFTADVSHELRTPLSSIKGFSEILSRNGEIKPEERQEFISLIQQESERMEYVLEDLMVISKMDRLDYELELSRTDISSLVDESISVLKKQITEKGLSYSVEVEPQVLYIDKYRISQVVMNLIKNAINYTDEGRIDIKGFVDKDYYVLSFEDSGIGIEEKNIDRVFKRFYRVDKARSRDSGGSGLGLSICKNVIIKHNGTIHVDSKINEGSNFIIKLPIKE